MALKDILAILISPKDDAALDAAAGLAARFDASLCAAYITALPDEPLSYEPAVVGTVWGDLLKHAREQGKQARADITARLKASGRPCAMVEDEALSRDLGRVAAVHARYCDMSVIVRPAADSADAHHDLAVGVLFHSGRPALIVPPGWNGGIGKRPVIAWDASREATRALSDARGLISDAEAAAVVTVNAKPRPFGHGETPGAAIAAHLARRGLKTEIRNAKGDDKSVADALLSEAKSFGADLIIAGGYGHARLRELMFGGVTRELLQRSDLPLLMAH